MKKKNSTLLSIIFITTLLLIGGQSKNTEAAVFLGHYNDLLTGTNNLNNTVNNSATLGDTLMSPEKGWERYDDSHSNIQLLGGNTRNIADVSTLQYKNTFTMIGLTGDKIQFAMNGKRIRLLGVMYPTLTGPMNGATITIDGKKVSNLNIARTQNKATEQGLIFEYNFSEFGIHNIEIEPIIGNHNFSLDAIDIDSSGELIETKSIPALEYEAHVAGLGWLPWVNSDAIAGTVGRNIQMEAIRMRINKPYANDNNLHIQYRAHVAGLGWLPWKQDGEIAGTVGQNIQMEAIQMRIVDNNGVPRSDYELYYSAHVQNKGWLPEVATDGIAGTVGQGLQMEALKVRAFKKN